MERRLRLDGIGLIAHLICWDKARVGTGIGIGTGMCGIRHFDPGLLRPSTNEDGVVVEDTRGVDFLGFWDEQASECAFLCGMEVKWKLTRGEGGKEGRRE